MQQALFLFSTLSFLALGTLSLAQACGRHVTGSNDSSATASKKDDSELVHCKDREDKKGKAVKGSDLKVSLVDSSEATDGLVALGFNGMWSEQESLGYSQGDQPIFSGYKKKDGVVTLTALRKT